MTLIHATVRLRSMDTSTSVAAIEAAAARFSDALVSEIKAEAGRRDLSSRALGRLIGKSSAYMSDRLDGGSSKTGKRVTLTVRDLAAICSALEVDPADLVRRAREAADAGTVVAFPKRTPVPESTSAAARTAKKKSRPDEV
ncbi:helix-turn-helix domain-containing protein [Nocardioides sp. CPCC 205120]|uniref:helix-turn-helix domain-containing protein n=1 Tax=Nocardioides sp. CPCC 205120 TaxID=3406462 RepID=UPI003B4FFC47